MPIQITYFKPNKLLKIAKLEMASIPNEELFSKSKYQKLTEKHAAATFVVAYGKYVRKCQVGLNETKNRMDADFFIEVDDKKWPFQLTERQEVGRRRGDEYKLMANGKKETLPINPGGKIESIKWIKQAIERKVERKYAGGESLNLLVYENFSFYEIDYGKLKTMAARYIGKFASIWIISNSRVCSLFSYPELGKIVGWKKLSTK